MKLVAKRVRIAWSDPLSLPPIGSPLLEDEEGLLIFEEGHEPFLEGGNTLRPGKWGTIPGVTHVNVGESWDLSELPVVITD